MDQRPKYKSQYHKTYIRNLHKIEFGNTPKAQVTKEKTDRLDHIKIKACVSQDMIKSEKATYTMRDVIYKLYIW